MKPLTALLVAFAALAVSCGKSDTEKQADRQATTARMKEKAESRLAKGVMPRITKTEYGEVVSISVPTPSRSGLYVHETECVVWRDERMQRVAIACDGEASASDYSLDQDPSRGDAAIPGMFR